MARPMRCHRGIHCLGDILLVFKVIPFMQPQPKNIRLFIKPGCPWCDDAIDWLDGHRISYETLDVISDATARREMHELTGQTMAPSIDVDGKILADFGADELEHWWKRQGFAA
jgi:monothiol glutaredoxin